MPNISDAEYVEIVAKSPLHRVELKELNESDKETIFNVIIAEDKDNADDK